MTLLESFSLAVSAMLLVFGGIVLGHFGHKMAGFWCVIAGGLIIGCAQILYYKLKRKAR